jgi:site-specific recombinase XerD
MTSLLPEPIGPRVHPARAGARKGVPAKVFQFTEQDPRREWPAEAKALFVYLVEHYGEHDPLPDAAGGWIARFSSKNTYRTYARGFRVWEAYARAKGIHPLDASFPLADAFARHLETVPTLVRATGRGWLAMDPTGKPRSEASRANVLSACSSFYTYAVRLPGTPLTADPFAEVRRPRVDPDHSDTAGLLPEETARLVAAARASSPRAYALVVVLYTLFLRVDSLLALEVEDLDYDRGHHVLRVTVKGGKKRVKPLPPLAYDALKTYIGDRATGPLFTTRGDKKRLSQSEVWKCLRRLAKKAGLEQAATIHPHVLRHNGITDALEAGVPLQDVQDAADHRDPRTTQRRNRRRRALENHPGYQLAAKLSAQADPR